jgi:hypothetical protein
VATVRAAIDPMAKAARGAVAYVVNTRLPAQRDEVLARLREALGAEAVVVGGEPGVARAEVAAGWGRQVEAFAAKALGTWARAALDGLVARVGNQWQPYAAAERALAELGLARPPIEPAGAVSEPATLRLPPAREERVPGFGAALGRVLRSAMGVTMMLAMVVASAGSLFGTTRGSASTPSRCSRACCPRRSSRAWTWPAPAAGRARWWIARSASGAPIWCGRSPAPARPSWCSSCSSTRAR